MVKVGKEEAKVVGIRVKRLLALSCSHKPTCRLTLHTRRRTLNLEVPDSDMAAIRIHAAEMGKS